MSTNGRFDSEGGAATGGTPASSGAGAQPVFEVTLPTTERTPDYPHHSPQAAHYQPYSSYPRLPQYQQYPQQHHRYPPSQEHQEQQQHPQSQNPQKHGQIRASSQHQDIQTPRHSHPPPSHTHIPSPQQHTHDHSLLLISLAEAYFETAHKIGASAATGQGNDIDLYYKLMATGLACLESLLLPQKGKTIQARLEVMVRLRYAAILFEETDNMRDAETVLLKGIITASRNNNLLDLNFSMQHLLVRVMFQMNSKAALIQLQKYTKEAEERESPLWAYAFRFLRCSLLMENSQCRDVQMALHGLRTITMVSQRRNDIPVFILSSLMEALISLHLGPEGLEAAQRALSRTNSMQLEEPMSAEIEFLRLIVDLVCSLMLGRPNAELELKLKGLQEMLNMRENWENWSPTGDFQVAVHPPRQGRTREHLQFRWFARDDIFIIGYFLSGMARFQSNAQENQKAEKYLKEGLRRLELGLEANNPTPYSAPAAANRIQYRKLLRCFMLLYLAFLFAVRTEWDEAMKSLEILHECISKLPKRQDTPIILDKLVLYLSGTVYQGTGDLEQALDFYEKLIYDGSEIGIMATMNTVLILRGEEQRDDRRADSLLRGIERICLESKNNLIKAAFYCVKGTERGELIKSKKFLATALQSAQQLANQQIIFIVLSFMCHRFFNGVVSEQAEKSARAAYLNSKKGKDNMWSLMSGRMLEDCLARQGHELDEEESRVLHASWEVVTQNLCRSIAQEGI